MVFVGAGVAWATYTLYSNTVTVEIGSFTVQIKSVDGGVVYLDGILKDKIGNPIASKLVTLYYAKPSTPTVFEKTFITDTTDADGKFDFIYTPTELGTYSFKAGIDV
jgi:hypothetical protein